MAQTIGFMGMGIMGVPMATNLLKAGYPLVVYNRTGEKTRPLVGQGAKAASSPRELAESCEVIVVMVTGPYAIQELLWGKDGAAEAFDDTKTFIQMSSVSPTYTRGLAKQLQPTKVAFIDAPVSGSKKPAEDAQLIILAGGEEAQVDAVKPLLSTMGKLIVYCGEVGQGSMMKMMINLLLGIEMAALSEVLEFGKKGGLELDAMLEVIQNGPLNCKMFNGKVPMIRSGEYSPQFPLKHMRKDLKFVVDTAYDIGGAVPSGHTVLQLFNRAMGRNLGDLDLAAVHEVLKVLNEG